MSPDAYRFEDSPSAAGAQGEVYFGTRTADGQAVALKVASGRRGAIGALKQEGAVLQALAGAGVGGVVPCLDFLERDGRPAIVMPRYPRHLGDWLNRAVVSPGPETLDQALYYCSALAYTLGRVHKTPWQGGTLVHRDIKPENVFIDDHGNPFIGDFGGAMAIDGLARVELTLFGTPMWAPLDQILPGQTIPDPTWDTYALCVFLYAAITGARPAYQSDPRTLLTDAGRDLWEVGRKAVEGQGAERADWAKHFARMRRGAKAADLVDVTGHGALVDADRAAIDNGLKRLANLAGLSDRERRTVARALWDVLVRGLSPVSHPSPPNRFRDGLELGELLDDLRIRARPQRSQPREPAPVHREPFEQARPAPRREPPKTSLGRSLVTPLMLLFLTMLALSTIGTALWLWQEPLLLLASDLRGLPDRVAVEGGKAKLHDGNQVDVSGFVIARLEATVDQWAECVAAEECPVVEQLHAGDHPAVGLSLEDARAFCSHVGGRLPTETEWMRAVGTGPMPWGDARPTCDRAVALGCGDALQPVGSARAGRTPQGVEDLAGNAWEWSTSPDGGVLLGGDARSPLRALGRAGRQVRADGGAIPTSGVRCVWPLDG